MNRKSQVSVEFMIVIAIALVMFMFLLDLASRQSQQLGMQSTRIYARQLADNFAQEMDALFIAGNGASKRIDLPDTLQDNTPYSLAVYPEYRVVEINYTSFGTAGRYNTMLTTSQIKTSMTYFAKPVTLQNDNGVMIIK